MNQNVKAKASENCVFELWVFVHDDRHDADVRKKSASPSYNIFPEKKRKEKVSNGFLNVMFVIQCNQWLRCNVCLQYNVAMCICDSKAVKKCLAMTGNVLQL